MKYAFEILYKKESAGSITRIFQRIVSQQCCSNVYQFVQTTDTDKIKINKIRWNPACKRCAVGEKWRFCLRTARKIEFVEVIHSRSPGRSSESPDYIDNQRRYASYVARREWISSRLRRCAESKLIFQIEDGSLSASGGFQRFNLPCDSFETRPNVSRRGAAPSLDVASVDPLILGRDLQARDAPARDAPTRHNAHGSLLRFRFHEEWSDVRLTIQDETSAG